MASTRRTLRAVEQRWIPRLSSALAGVRLELEELEHAEGVRHRWAAQQQRQEGERVVTGFAASLFRRNAVAVGGDGIPRRRRFRGAGKSVEIDTDKSPTLAIACRPFEIVQ